MAGIVYVPVCQVLCKLQITQDSRSLLPSKLCTRSYLLSLGTEGTSSLIFRISHSNSRLPNFPLRFELSQVRKVYSKFTSEGKITLEVVNCPHSVLYSAQPSLTLILVSEASPEGLSCLLAYFSPRLPSSLPGKSAPFLTLSIELFSVIYSCLGPTEGKKLRLLNKRLYEIVGEVVQQLTVGKGAKGEIVRRLIERCKGLKELRLTAYRGTAIALREALKSGLIKLDLLNCYLPDCFLTAISPSALVELRLTGFSAPALAAFLPHLTHISALYLTKIELNSVLLQALQALPTLTLLSISYKSIEAALRYHSNWSSTRLSSVFFLPSHPFPTLSPALQGLWTSLLPSNLQEIGCDIELDPGLTGTLQSVKRLLSCSLPLQALPCLAVWTVYISGEELLEWLEHYGTWLSRLQRLTVVLRNDWLVPTLRTQLSLVMNIGKIAIHIAKGKEPRANADYKTQCY